MGYSGKRLLDLGLGILLLLGLGWLLLLLLLCCAIDTVSNGLFLQERVGQYGKPFMIYKLRTFHSKLGTVSTWGKLLRKSKLDELPQIINILKGEMSIVGPRPDVTGYYDLLKGEQGKVLCLKPGLTSKATLKYIDEEALLSKVEDKFSYNNNVIFPDKVNINLDYYYNQSLMLDLKLIGLTLKSILIKR